MCSRLITEENEDKIQFLSIELHRNAVFSFHEIRRKQRKVNYFKFLFYLNESEFAHSYE